MADISTVERLKTVSLCKEPEMTPTCTVNTAALSLSRVSFSGKILGGRGEARRVGIDVVHKV